MSDAISEGIKEDREMERREFIQNSKSYANELRELFSVKRTEEKKLHQISHRYEQLKKKFLNAGFFVKDDEHITIYKEI